MSDTSHDLGLTAELHRISMHVAAPPDGRHHVAVRVAARRRRRRRARLGAASVLVVVATLTATQLGPDTDGRARTELATRSPQDDQDAPTADRSGTTTAPAAEELPRLVIEHPDHPPARAHIQDEEVDPRTTRSGAQHIQSFRPAEQAWGTPMVFVRTTRDPTFGIGDLAPSELVTVVDVNGSSGYLVESDETGPSLGWRLPDGTAAFVVAVGIDGEALVGFGRSLHLRPDGRGWDVEQVPTGLVPVVDAELTPPPRWRSQEVTYGTPRGPDERHPISLQTMATTPGMFEDLVADRAHGAEAVRTVSVRGAPAAVITVGAEVVVLWSEQAGTVANELRLAGPAAADVDEVLERMTVLGPQAWRELVAGAQPG